MALMIDSRLHSTFLLRIWREPSQLAPPGEWRGSLRRLDEPQEKFFKSPEQLWQHLVHLQHAQDEAGRGKTQTPVQGG